MYLVRRSLVITVVALTAIAQGIAAAAPARVAVEPALRTCDSVRLKLDGWVGGYVRNVTDNWLMVAPDSNPAMLQMLRDRDRLPRRDLLPWSGEFAGKYLTGAAQVYRVTRDEKLRSYVDRFVKDLVACQDTDGYLGPFHRPARLGWGLWDSWGHYHVMVGLILWSDVTGDKKALSAATRIADMFCARFLNAQPGGRLVDTGSTEMNLAPIHSLLMLYRRVGEPRYLELAKQLADEFAATGPNGPLAGDYIRCSLAGKEYYQTPRPRWESLHSIMGIAELYWVTGDERYRRAFEQIWWSITKLDRHNNGGFSSGEQAQGNPYHQGAIESCCTIAWTAMGVEMLKLTGDSRVADEIELSTLNSIVGMHSPTGRWMTYNTPMDGVKRGSGQDIAFQAREGSPELSCCSVNGARGFGMIGDWALMSDRTGVAVNYYGPCSLGGRLPSDGRVTIREETRYPAEGSIRLKVTPEKNERFALRLRIPYWSARTEVSVNGVAVKDVRPGSYLSLDRVWSAGDTIDVRLDMSLRYWVGERECAGKTSIFRGPILLTYDRRFNTMDPDAVPTIDALSAVAKQVKFDGSAPPMTLVEIPAAGGSVRLCDFAGAGWGGTPYRSWLPVSNASAAEFGQANPLRTWSPAK